MMQNNMRAIRLEKKMTLAQVAGQLVENKMTKQNLAHLEHSKRINVQLINELARIYSCSAYDLIKTDTTDPATL